MNMIEIQDAYVARVYAAHCKINSRTKGNRFQRSRSAARKEATARLLRHGFKADDITLIIKDAHDVFLLEIGSE
jgi:hypothetical protein